jgi:autotransporter-associated beta strand protein
MRLTSANTYAGGTIVSAGRLLVNNSTGSGTGTGGVTVNSGTLGGTGTIAGLVTVNSAGTVSPGISIGTLTLNTSPILSGTTSMEINRNGGAPLADKIVLTSGTLNYGGTLVVSNAGAALLGGEVFTLFAAPAYSSGFASENLPSLGADLNWYTGLLANNGTIKVNRKPAASPPTFTNLAPAVLQISFATLTGNATDPDADPLTVAGVNLTTTNGIALTTNATSIFYANPANATDQFSYALSDGHGGSVTGVVNIVNIGSSPSAQFAGLPAMSGDSVVLHFSATPGWTYYLERSTNLLGWNTIWTNIAPANGEFDYTDDFHDLSAPASPAFYRLRWAP